MYGFHKQKYAVEARRLGYKGQDAINHIDKKHQELIPEGYYNIFGHVHDYAGENWERGHCVSVEQIEMKPADITYMCQTARNKFDKLQKERKMANEN